ncbi:hypothetical protein CLIB1423_07S03158 [[Candida] railenensis]|uniref:Secreted protein n=1 Tax=[Candida] railenensis TaxID=45579 RepID=A0A9P0VYJ0_9ASCO|nr:hypothetical protein CLIB1423_07S03158 [[Candida] railenensis]
MKLHILICTVVVLSYGSTITRPEYEKRSNALDFFKVVKDAAKAKLLEGLSDGSPHENDDSAGQDNSDESNAEEDDEADENGDDSSDEDELEAEIYDNENPMNRYNAGKMSQLRAAQEMGISQFEVDGGRNSTGEASESIDG